MHIEVLYFEGCPSYERLLDRLGQLAPAEQVGLRRIDSEAEAVEERFLGSPSLRVDGQDVEPGAETRSTFGLFCRLYATGSERLQVPPDEWILAAIERARGPEP